MFSKSMKIFLALLLISIHGLSYGSDSTASSSSSAPPGGGVGVPEPEEEIRYRKISSTGNHVDVPESLSSMAEGFLSAGYFQEWHAAQQTYVKGIDQGFFHPGETHKKNICSIRLTLTEKNPEGGIYPIILNFDEMIFVSGKSLGFGEDSEGGVLLGTMDDLSGRRYGIEAHPTQKNQPLAESLQRSLKSETFLKRLNDSTRDKTVLCIEDFYPNLDGYRDSIISYLGLNTVLGKQTAEMKKFFEKKIEKVLPKPRTGGKDWDKERRDEIFRIYEMSLRYAPFRSTDGLPRNIQDLLSKINNGDGLEGGLNIEENFCDSEQSIRLFLTGPLLPECPLYGTCSNKKLNFDKKHHRKKILDDIWRKLKDQLTAQLVPLDIKNIAGVFVDIASRRHMCNTCYHTYKVDVESGRTMLAGILDQLGFEGIDTNSIDNLNYEFLISGSINHGK